MCAFGAVASVCCRGTRVQLREGSRGVGKSQPGTGTARRVWKCKACRKQFTALVGTVFHGTKVPLRKWLMAIWMMCAGKNGVSAHEIHRSLRVTYKTA